VNKTLRDTINHYIHTCCIQTIHQRFTKYGKKFTFYMFENKTLHHSGIFDDVTWPVPLNTINNVGQKVYWSEVLKTRKK